MSRIIETVSGITGVINGGNATLGLQVNRRYHHAKLFCSALLDTTTPGTFDVPTTDPLDIIESVQLLVNGNEIIDLPAQDFFDLYELDYGGVVPTDHRFIPTRVGKATLKSSLR
jgi:hypothetical protein